MAAPLGRLALELVLAPPKLARDVRVVLDRALEAIPEALATRIGRRLTDRDRLLLRSRFDSW